MSDLSITDKKNVDFQRLGLALAEAGAKAQEIAYFCDSAPASAYDILAGRCGANPRWLTALGLLELAKKYGLEVPLMGSDAA